MATLTSTTSPVQLAAARVYAGLLGAIQLAGVVFFVFLAPEEAVWRGPVLDIPVVTLMVAGILTKLFVAGWPGLPTARRIALGYLAVAIGMAVTLAKIPLYDEPEGVIFLGLDAVLLGLLLLAARSSRH